MTSQQVADRLERYAGPAIEVCIERGCTRRAARGHAMCRQCESRAMTQAFGPEPKAS